MIDATGDGGEERVEHFEEAILSFWVSKPEVCSRVTVKKYGCYFLFLSSSKEGRYGTHKRQGEEEKQLVQR